MLSIEFSREGWDPLVDHPGFRYNIQPQSNRYKNSLLQTRLSSLMLKGTVQNGFHNRMKYFADHGTWALTDN
jgi:hypothetical protein